MVSTELLVLIRDRPVSRPQSDDCQCSQSASHMSESKSVHMLKRTEANAQNHNQIHTVILMLLVWKLLIVSQDKKKVWRPTPETLANNNSNHTFKITLAQLNI